MIQILFTDCSGRPFPHPPRDGQGRESVADGDFVFTLEQAAERFQIHPSALRDLYADSVAQSLTDADAAELGIERAQGQAARRRSGVPLVHFTDDDRASLDRMYGWLALHHQEMLVQSCLRRGVHPCDQTVVPRYVMAPTLRGRRRRFVLIIKLDAMIELAKRSGSYIGPTESRFCGRDGEWREIWGKTGEFPFACKIGIRLRGEDQPISATAEWETYVQYVAGDQSDRVELEHFWQRMPTHMLEKCALAKAIRRVFPEHTSGFYIDEEMGQAENPLTDPQQGGGSALDFDADTGEVHEPTASPLAQPPSELSEPELREKLHRMGADIERQELLLKSFTRKHWDTFKRKPRLFYAMVLDRVLQNPPMYGLRAG